MARRDLRNELLLRLTDEDYEALAPHLRRVELRLRHNLTSVGDEITHVYFPEFGLSSVIAEVPNSDSIEVGLVGKEGMTDQVHEPGDVASLRCMVQVAGSALAVEASDYALWITGRPSALKLFTRYLQATQVQVSFTALSHGSFTIEERLARWLMMCFDRTDGNDVPLVHQFLAMMLAVRRSGVTTAINALERHGAITAMRGQIILRDRATLESLTRGAYGFPEREYRRLMGPLPH
jgi:CRP-like cAMP-binding protein